MAVSNRIKRETTIKDYTMYGGIGIVTGLFIEREKERAAIVY